MTTNRLTIHELVDRARTIAPVLFSRAEEAERLRHCPPASVDDWFTNGFDLVHKPARFGGLELGWDALCETGLALSHGCAAQGWVLTIYGDHTQALGMFPRRAQDEVWDDPRALISTSFGTMGRARKVTGGAVLSGKWSFSSGIDHAHWVMAGSVMSDGDGGLTEPTFFLLPKSEVTVIDDWHVIGLSGSGSKSFLIDEVFVPDHRMMNAAEAAAGRPHPDSGNDAPVFHTPRRSTAGLALAAVGVGAAQGMLGQFVHAAKGRVSRGAAVADEQWLQIQIAESTAMLRAAELLILSRARATMARFAEGGEADIALRADDKRDAGFAALLARQAADRLYGVAGGHALHSSNPLQRYFRDVHASTAHFALRWEHSAVPYARLTLGLEPGPGYY
jgi:alkylation response protein AidB-like acyl-CoA dehydrogenase